MKATSSGVAERDGHGRDEVVAEIHPPSNAVRPRRRSGALRGRIRIADDFDPLPPDVLAAMEDETA